MPINNESRRILIRGTNHKFKVTFFADAAQTIPLTPLDSLLYPSYTIYDINNDVIQSGVGQPEATPGMYKAEFQVPSDALLSNDLRRWRIEWLLVSTDNRQVQFIEEFDVNDTVITASETREQKFITLTGQETRIVLRLPNKPLEVYLDVFVANSINNKVIDNVGTGVGGIQEAMDGDSIVYYYDIPGAVFSNGSCTFSLIWKYRNTVAEPLQFVYQVLTSVTPQVLAEVTAVRMLIDKFQKRLGTVQAYEDSDIVEYLERGHELVNSVYPTTFFGFGYLPSALTVYHVLFSSWYGLNAQQLAEIDLGFDFSGQTVTLNYDHASALSDVMGRWLDFVNENLPKAKLAITRRTRPVGTVAGRAYRYTDINLYTFKIASIQGSTNNIVTTLTNLGLLF